MFISQLRICLVHRHIFLPKLRVIYPLASEKLPPALPAFVYLDSIFVPVPLYFRASAKIAFFLFIIFDLCLSFANIGIPIAFSLTFVNYIKISIIYCITALIILRFICENLLSKAKTINVFVTDCF